MIRFTIFHTVTVKLKLFVFKHIILRLSGPVLHCCLVLTFFFPVQAQAQEHGTDGTLVEISASLSESDLSRRDKDAVAGFIRKLTAGEKSEVLKSMSYPVQRDYPLPPIRDEEELLGLYDTVFDRSFIRGLSGGEWNDAGWRGIMYNGGQLWGDVDENGQLLIRYISTPSSKAYLEKCIRRQKQRLHKSVREFSVPLIWLRSAGSRIRIDELSDGSVRYAEWPVTGDISSAPALVIMNGMKESEGSMPVRCYEFRTPGYRYVISEDASSEEYPYHIEILDVTDRPVRSEGAVIEYTD